MGNSAGKEARGAPQSAQGRGSATTTASPRQDSQQSYPDVVVSQAYRSRPRRASRPDLSFLGIGLNSDQEVSSLEARRESKHERETRKAEKEKSTRLKERERSMKEEHVDGGYLVTQGVYVGVEDYSKSVVRQLMIERRLAPFWRGLNDFSESWAEHQLMAAARGMIIPPADQVPPELEYRMSKKSSPDSNQGKEKSSKTLGIPIGSRTQSFQSDNSPTSPTSGGLSLPSPSLGASTSPSSALFRTRAKTLASLTTSSRSNSQTDMVPRELQLPVDPFVNGQPIEAYLYKDATECPICFLYYPPYLNTTRCCDQAICSECFVQIKRPDPHQPEHEQPDPNAPPVSEAEREVQADGQLVSEVATCPYCKQPEFGISYVPPPFRRGLTYNTTSQPYQAMSAMSSQTSLSSSGLSPGPGRRRGTSLSANAPEVITTDKIRPDWANKLATARAHAARRSAAATALHTAAYLMNGQGDPRPFGPFSRRGLIRRPTLEGSPGTNPHLDALAMLAERHAARQQEMGQTEIRGGNPFLPPPRGSSSRRSRMEDLEDMMMMEAIRLSLASEEERRKKEDKDAKKEAKKKEKEAKKAEKAGRKNSLFTLHSNTSNGEGASSPLEMERSRSATSSIAEEAVSSGKGKAVERASASLGGGGSAEDDSTSRQPVGSQPTSLLSVSEESLSSSFPPLASEPFKRSHLRQMSNASSSASSFVEAGSQAFTGSSTPPGGGAGMDSMFNFRSLAAMIGDEEKMEELSHREHAGSPGRAGSFEDIGDKPGSLEIPSSPDVTEGHQNKINGSADGPVKELGGISQQIAASAENPARYSPATT